ncbi:MAG TPA: ATP-binding protein [Trebonia sp.]|jgi:signal transduction histidine kinase
MTVPSVPNAPRVTITTCDAAELRTLFLFEKLSDEQLATLCNEGHVEIIEPGVVFNEGDPADCLYVLIEGELVTSRKVGGDEVDLARTGQRGVYSGAYMAYVGDRMPQVYQNSMRVIEPSRFFVLGAACFSQIMNDWFPMPVHLLEGLFFGGQATREVIGQRERLLALGSLTAGLTHELNNPAAAAVRATASLRERVAGMRGKLRLLAGGKFERASLESIIELQQRAVEKVSKAPKLDALETSDREDELTDWLDDHGISDGWQLAPTFVQAGLDTEWLDQVQDTVGDGMLEPALRWLNYTVETELLMTEIEDATTRITTLVGAARQYSQLDRAPFQVADVHDLLNSTLLMMSAKLKGITINKQYDRSLPAIPAYAAELNQVWTNLIDNAIAAMAGTGTLTIRTARDNDQVLVEVGDTGPGIPEDIQKRIFEPFFTTKPFGEGTGLGLDIAWRIVVKKHHGDLRVESQPGDTRFQVRLPLQQAQPDKQEQQPQEA